MRGAFSGLMRAFLLISTALTLAFRVQQLNALSNSPVVEWAHTYGGSGSELGTSLVQTSDGGYGLLGMTSSFGAGMYDLLLVKTDSYGSQMWSRTYGGAKDERTQRTNCLKQTTDGGFILVGVTESFGAGGSDIWLIKTDFLVLWNGIKLLAQ